MTNDQLIPSADDTEAIDNVFGILTSRPDAKTLVVFATGSSLRLVLEQFQNRSLFGQYYLVLIADWTSDPSLQEDFVDIAPGKKLDSFTVVIHIPFRQFVFQYLGFGFISSQKIYVWEY